MENFFTAARKEEILEALDESVVLLALVIFFFLRLGNFYYLKNGSWLEIPYPFDLLNRSVLSRNILETWIYDELLNCSAWKQNPTVDEGLFHRPWDLIHRSFSMTKKDWKVWDYEQLNCSS